MTNAAPTDQLPSDVSTLSDAMPSNPDLTQDIHRLMERVERLLLRHAELQRTNLLLTQQVSGLISERDALRTRLHTARARVDALIGRLPDPVPPSSTGVP